MDCEVQGGINIENEFECETACNELGIEIEVLRNKDTSICYVGGNDKCRHRGQIGKHASRICKNSGII